MAGKRSADTIAALLSSAPGIEPGPEPDAAASRRAREVAPVAPVADVVAVDDADLDDSDLEAFELEADRPLIRPRRRPKVDYQTVRVFRTTSHILRAQWLLARRADPLLSYTEFSTIVVQEGLRSLSNRPQPD